MEKWTVMNQGIIPKGKYITDLKYGEDYGLLITLKNDTFCITLDFGAVVSVHCIDEGGMLFPPFAHDPYSLYRKDRFKEILYKIENSSYHNFILPITGELYKPDELHHYLIVTLDYFINIMSIWGIDISVENLRTHEKTHSTVEQSSLFLEYIVPLSSNLSTKCLVPNISMPVDTFERYLKELKDKYPPSIKIRSNTNRQIDEQELHGRQILEIPASNKTFDKIKEYEALARDKYGIELRYREE